MVLLRLQYHDHIVRPESHIVHPLLKNSLEPELLRHFVVLDPQLVARVLPVPEQCVVLTKFESFDKRIGFGIVNAVRVFELGEVLLQQI